MEEPSPLLSAHGMEEPPPMAAAAMEESPSPLLSARGMEEPPPMAVAAMEDSPLPLSVVEEIIQHGLADHRTQGFVVEEVIEHRKDEVVVHAEDGFNVGHEDDAVVLLPAVGDHGPEGEKKEQVQQSSSLIIMFIHGCSSIVHIF
jgi:hypothetical protein